MTFLKSVTDVLDGDYDTVVFVNDSIEGLQPALKSVQAALTEYSKVHPKLKDEIAVVPFPDHPSKRMIFSPTGPLNRDYDDSRRIYDAANEGIKKAVKLGCKRPLLASGHLSTARQAEPWTQGPYPTLNLVLGACYAAYTPLEIRESVPERREKLQQLGVLDACPSVIKLASALEEGRRVARDIGGSDPERMAAPRVAEFLLQEFPTGCGVQLRVDKIDDKEYPLMAAVNRAASGVERHDGRVIHLDYEGSESGDASAAQVFLVGKGITYDTGGCDIKAGGVMAGMHRDKCGAAAVAGLFKVLSILRPPKLTVSGALAFVRNSVGSNAYVADEIITSRAKKRVRVGNTDAEGRMVMADLLCEAKEKAVKAANPFLFTVATLTGHVIRAYNDSYTAVLDNGPARQHKVSQQLQAAGDLLSEPAEISTIRREDFAFHKGKTEYEDILQCNNQPSTLTARGHQTPSAFLIMASGLDEHGLDSKHPLPYTHVDCAGSAGMIGTTPTGAPLIMLATHFVLPRIL